MRISNLPFAASMVVAAGAMVLPAHASFQFLSVETVGTVETAAGPRTVYRIYAEFSQGADRVVSWGGTALSPMSVYTGPCTGQAFFQAPFGAFQGAPAQADINKDPDTQWDTFATIGVSVADQAVPFDSTTFSPGFPAFIDGATLSTSGTVSLPVSAAQGRADFAGDGDPALRVLIMQLTMGVDEYPYGMLHHFQWRNSIGQTFTASGFVMWQGLAAHGRCCLPNGTCINTYHSSCEQFVNGYFLNCQSCEACSHTCVPDVVPHPGDGVVNVQDLLAVISSWGPHDILSTVPADVAPPQGNNVVNVEDLLVVIAGWGRCPP